MTNTVCVLTNYRTGSTAFTLLKSREHDLPYKGELFSHERPWDYGPHLSHWEELEIIRCMKNPDSKDPRIEKYKDRIETEWNVHRDFKGDWMKEIAKGTPICFKMMPDHVVQPWNPDPPHTDQTDDIEILKSCDKVYLLYRRDWKAQLKSWIGIRANGKFGDNGLKDHRKSGDPRGVDYHFAMHVGDHYEIDEVKKPVRGDMHGQWVEQLKGQLKYNYLRMAYLYKNVPGIELVCMEDYFEQTPYLPYNHKVIWEDGEPDIPEFDVEGLFK